MPVDIFWVTTGFVIGVVATAFALEVAFRKVRNDERASLSKDWTFKELSTDGPPSVVATQLEGADLPPGTRVLVPPGAKLSRQMVRRCNLRIHPDAKGNFAVGSGRGVLCTGPMQPGTLALTTVHPALISKLARSFESLWVQGKPYTQKVQPDQIPANEGTNVTVEGIVQDVLSSGEKALVTLETSPGGGRGTVVVPANLPLEKGKAYAFGGTVVKEAGRPAVRAESVKEIATSLTGA